MAGMTRFDIEPAYACLSCMRQVPSFEVWQRHTERGLVFTHHAADGHPVVRIVFREQQAQAPPASDPPRLGCESPSNCDPKLDLCTHCQARTAPNGLTPPSWITARQSDPPGLVELVRAWQAQMRELLLRFEFRHLVTESLAKSRHQPLLRLRGRGQRVGQQGG